MLNRIIIYSTSTGLLRTVTFLASVVLSKSYEMGVIGEYVLMQTIAQLLVPFLTLNLTTAMTREACSSPLGAIQLIRYIRTATIVVAVFGVLLSFIFKAQYWICFGFALGASEALFATGSSFFLGRERSTLILAISAIRVTGTLTIICMAYLRVIDMFALSLCMVVLNFTIAAYFAHQAVASAPKLVSSYSEEVSPKQMFTYSVATLPHTVALWISASSDRFLLGALINKEAVAQYTMCYTVAQSVMLVISGVVSAVPPRVANDPETWRVSSHVVLFLKNLTRICLFVAIVNVIIVYLDRSYFGFIPNLTVQSYLLTGLISTGFFFSVLYVFFASYLYLNRSTNVLKIAGFLLAPLNLLVMYTAVSLWAQVGAAVAIIFSYLSFGVAYGYAAARCENVIQAVWPSIVRMCLIFLLSIVCFAIFVSYVGELGGFAS